MSRTPPAEIPCPRCGAPVGSEQAWCLTCGAPARTRMRPTPNWKLPLLAIAAIVLIVAGGTVGAFVALTTDNEAPKASTATATVPEATPPPAATGTPTDPNVAPNVDPNAAPSTDEAAPPVTTTDVTPPADTNASTETTPPPATTTAPN